MFILFSLFSQFQYSRQLSLRFTDLLLSVTITARVCAKGRELRLKFAFHRTQQIYTKQTFSFRFVDQLCKQTELLALLSHNADFLYVAVAVRPEHRHVTIVLRRKRFLFFL